MRHLLQLPGLLLAALLVAGTLRADPPQAEIVVAMRYLQQTGTSRAHLYLYRADGKLLRQLTDDNKGQDFAPAFAPDGETIVFTRKPDTGEPEHWSVEPRGGNLRRLTAAPDWYAQGKESPYFTELYNDPDKERLFTDADGKSPGPPLTFRAPDGSAELVLKVAGEEDSGFDQEGHGRLYVLRNLRSGKETTLGKLPGFVGLTNLLALGQDKGQRFLLSPPLRVAFFELPLGSQDGAAMFALDLDGKRLVRLAFNAATPYPLPGEPAFLTLTESRYVPFGDGKRTANCTYVERWGADLKAVRYAKANAPGICYGASMYRPALTPAVVSIASNEP